MRSRDHVLASAEAPRDVVLGQTLPGVGEDVTRGPALDEVAGAVLVDQEERGVSLTRAACCMLWVTITIVYLVASARMGSSMRQVTSGRGPSRARP